MPGLDSITIKGFKSIAAVEDLRLGPINVLIGPNGSGKSNFIGAFGFLNAIRQGRLQEYVVRAGGGDRILHFGSKTTTDIVLHLSFGSQRNRLPDRPAPSGADDLLPVQETTYFWNKNRYPKPYDEDISRRGREAGISGKDLSGVAKYVADCLDSWRLYHPHDTGSASPMKKTANVRDSRFLRADGSNLPAFLYRLETFNSTAYSLIRKTVQRVAPFFEDFVLEPLPDNQESIRLEWKHKWSDAYFDASSLSDGTLRFIMLATLLLQPERLRPSIILVDEPELGLHPYAITLFASLIKMASIHTQVILSTQSPFLLDHFQPEDVLVT